MLKRRKNNILTFILILTLGITSCATTFKGRVIDADTKEPIEGAVIVASWSESRATPAGEVSRYKDVKETLTDKNGEWSITGPKGSKGSNITAIFTLFTGTHYTRPPQFIVFKPGYCSWPAGFGITACKEKIKPVSHNKVAEGETVELPKLTNREDRRRALPGTAGDSREFDKKQINFLKLINEEHKNIFGEGDLEDYIKELENEK
ncbi:MAG: carboxypeptidase-like regulatory domain-containing protein [Nitrospirota bacterium]